MNSPHENSTALKNEIVAQIAELSALLGMIPLDDTIEMRAPVMEKRMVLFD